VFELSPSSGGAWTETILHFFTFTRFSEGYDPLSNLVFDAAGNLYGTTLDGGTGSCPKTQSCGVVFELKPYNGIWLERVLHDFNENGTDGFFPPYGLTLDNAGNLYGTTAYGGTFDGGTVFVVAH
jgi:hypothetical protein